jgi:hypothetical protein
MVDLATIKPADRKIEIVHPGTKEPIGVRVSLMSYDDERLKKVRRQITDRRLADQQKNKPLKSDEAEENGNKLLFAAMTGWEWYDGATFKGEMPDFTPRNVSEVFSELPWFRAQVDTAVADEESFFDNSGSN